MPYLCLKFYVRRLETLELSASRVASNKHWRVKLDREVTVVTSASIIIC